MALPKFFGLDIGNHSIKAIRLSEDPEVPKLLGFAYGSMPFGAIASENEESQRIIAKSIKEIISASNLANIKQVVFAVSESHVVKRLMTLPYIDDKSLDTSVTYEMKKWVSSTLDDLRINKVVIGEKIQDGARVVDVLGIAAKVDYLDRYIRILEMAGLEPIAAENEGISIVRAIYPLAKSITSSYLIVDFGFASTDVCVGYKDKLMYSDSIPYGSYSITKAISQTFSMDMIKAEEYKKTYGVDPIHFNGKLSNVIAPVVDIILSDVRKTLEYFRREYSEIPPSKIFITGDGAVMPGLAKYVADKLKVEVDVANPWSGILVPQKDMQFISRNSSAYTVAIGLAKKRDI